MASYIRIKRSETSGNPAALVAGELAYSAADYTTVAGGGRLYIGIGTESGSPPDAAAHLVIGGKYFTDKLDHSPGTLTATSAIIVDANSKIDNFLVDNLQLNGNDITSTNVNGNINITPNGSGKTVITNVYIGDSSTSLTEYIQDATSVTIVPGEGIDVVYDDTAGTTTVSGEDATTSNKGIASFDGTDFTVTSGAVTLNAERIEDIVGQQFTTAATHSGISATYNDVGAALNLSLTTTGVTAGSYGAATSIPVLTIDAQGRITNASVASVSSTLPIAGDTGTDNVSLLTDTLSVVGGEGIDTAVTNNTITISGEDATTSNKGIASFDSADFSVTSGAVSIKTAGVGNSQLENSSVTFGTTTVSLGATSLSLAGLQQLDVDNIRIDGNEISSTNTDGNISLNPNGTGTVDLNAARISNLANPVNPQDAATRYYVDNAVTGLDWKSSVNLLADTNVALTGSTNTLVIDSHSALDSTDNGIYRILLKAQSTGSENGIYVYTDDGTTYTLVRATDADTYQELIGSSTFVLEGTVYGNTAWVQSNHYLTSFSGQTWVQFSGAGAYTAGDGLGQTGTLFFVNVAANGGIEISADALQLKSSTAGNGLSYSSGVLTVGGTADRITVGADTVDIAATYVGQSSITTLGTVTTGTWNATTLGTGYGGTGLTSYATGDLIYASATNTLAKLTAGAEGKVLQINASGVPVWGDVDGGSY